MNQAPNTQQQTVGNDTTFPSQPATNTNPFATDLKGEFTSNFGTNANTVSQIFKDGGFGSENRTKFYMIGGVVVLLAVIALFVVPKFLETEDDFAVTEDIATEETAPAEEVVAAEEAAPVEEAAITEEAAPVADAAPVDGSIALGGPESGASMEYDLTQSPMQFAWQSEGPSTIVFSRDANMSNIFRRVTANGSYAFHPYPGTWYWRVDSAGGQSEVRSFTVNVPARLSVSVSEPAAGQTVAGNGGVVRWGGDDRASYYRVEMAPSGSSDWSNPTYRFATSSQEAQLNNVAAGQYDMRVGAFSRVSGRWEYTNPQSVSVQ